MIRINEKSILDIYGIFIVYKIYYVNGMRTRLNAVIDGRYTKENLETTPRVKIIFVLGIVINTQHRP